MAVRYSKQRNAIWNCIKDRKDHPTADTIYQIVRKEQPKISLGTVYRNLVLLRDMGQLTTVDVGDGLIHFDPNVGSHSHFVCSSCGNIIDIAEAPPEEFRRKMQKAFPGRINSCEMLFRGVCLSCLQEQGVIPKSFLQQ